MWTFDGPSNLPARFHGHDNLLQFETGPDVPEVRLVRARVARAGSSRETPAVAEATRDRAHGWFGRTSRSSRAYRMSGLGDRARERRVRRCGAIATCGSTPGASVAAESATRLPIRRDHRLALDRYSAAIHAQCRRDHRRVGGHRTRDGHPAGARRRRPRDLRPAATGSKRSPRDPRGRRPGAALVGDVTSDADMQALVARALDRFGRLDVMVCNAGFGIYGAIDDIAPGADAAAARRQLHGHLSRRARRAAGLPAAGQRPPRSSCPQSSASAAFRTWAPTRRRSSRRSGLAECLRAELRERGIHVSVVFPISTETEFFQVMTSESGFATRAHGPAAGAPKRWPRRLPARDRTSGARGVSVREGASGSAS